MNAPVALFVHARPEHTRRTLAALAANPMAATTRVTVFADGPRNDVEASLVSATRRQVQSASGFLDVELVVRDVNLGLAANISDGVTRVCGEHGRVIVLEDDILAGPQFLTFMNLALDRYQHEPRVWHINAWNYPMDVRGLPSVFLWRLMHCWGWATWEDRWRHFSKDPADLIEHWGVADVHRFNLDGAQDFWAQVIANHRGTMNTWAVFWYATLFQRGGLCVSPAQALTSNTGLDGSGAHCSASKTFQGPVASTSLWDWPSDTVESAEAIACARDFMSRVEGSTLKRAMRWAHRVFSGRMRRQ
jgi:hypothetical protein